MRRYPVLPLAGFVALTTAAGWAAVARWAPGAPAPRLDPLAAPDLAIAWSARAVPAQALREDALHRLFEVLAVFAAMAAAAMLLSFAFRMSARALAQRRRVVVESALGAEPGHLRTRFLRQAARPLGIALAAGAALGGVGLAAAYAAWPGPDAGPPVGWLVALALSAAGCGALLALPLSALPSTLGSRHAPELLAAGERATPTRFEGGARRLVVGTQLGMTLALLGGSLGVAASATRAAPTQTQAAAGDLLVLQVEATGAERDWSAALSRLASVPSIRPESIASLGGWLGLGTRDFALAHCGACWRGGLPAPMLGAVVHHHAVSPGFFRDAGQRVLAGRDFAAADGVDAPPVAIVSADFARTSFQESDAVGRELRIGGDQRWYRVVGIVDDPSVPGLGRDARAAPSVYVPVAQHPPDRGEIALRGPAGLDADALSVALAGAGFRSLGPPRTAAAYRDASSAPLRWWAYAMTIVGALCLSVVVQSAYALAHADAAARRREMALRVALGSTRAAIVARMVGSAAILLATAAFWAAPLATAVGAAVGELAAGGSVVPVRLYLALCVALGVALGAGTLGPAREVARVDPGELLKG